MKKVCFIVLACFLFCGILYLFLHEAGRRFGHHNFNDNALEDSQIIHGIRTMYRSYCHTHKKPPSNLADFVPFADEHQRSFDAIKNGDWIIFWNTPLSENPRGNEDRILGHAKELPFRRDWVLTGGSASGMSFEEFQKEREEMTALHEIGKMYLSYWQDNKRPPANLDELKPLQDKYPQGYRAIQKGDWTILWGTSPSDNKNENFDLVLGYEPRASTNVGWILTADGSGITTTSDYFRDYMETIPISHEIWRMYVKYVNEHKKPPTELRDLEPYRKLYSRGFEAVRSGQWVVRWGVEISEEPERNSKRVLAYEEHVPTTTLIKGGYVIMADNSSNTMTGYGYNRALQDE